jgi:hypothetical protein
MTRHSPIRRQGKLLPGYQRHPGSIWIDDNRASLPNNEWVAADDSGLVAHDAPIDGLMAKIRDHHLDPANVAIAFITSDSA